MNCFKIFLQLEENSGHTKNSENYLPRVEIIQSKFQRLICTIIHFSSRKVCNC